MEFWPVVFAGERAGQRFPQSPLGRKLRRARRSGRSGCDCASAAILREGVADFKGSGHWSLEEFCEFRGLWRCASCAGRTIRLRSRRRVRLRIISVTDQQIKLSKLQGKLFGGSFTGDAQVDNWLHSCRCQPRARAKKGREEIAVITAARPPAKKREKAKVPGVQSGTVHLRLRDVSAGEMAAALDVPAHPLAPVSSGRIG